MNKIAEIYLGICTNEPLRMLGDPPDGRFAFTE